MDFRAPVLWVYLGVPEKKGGAKGSGPKFEVSGVFGVLDFYPVADPKP